MEAMSLYAVAFKLLLSLGIGILFGIERDLKGLQEGEKEDEAHFGGVRTFALIGLLGGICAYIGILISHPVYIYGFIAVVLFVAVSYIIEHRRGGKLGMTTEFSTLLTYSLGALCLIGPIQIVIAATIILLFLLSQKKTTFLLRQCLKCWIKALRKVSMCTALAPRVTTGPMIPRQYKERLTQQVRRPEQR